MAPFDNLSSCSETDSYLVWRPVSGADIHAVMCGTFRHIVSCALSLKENIPASEKCAKKKPRRRCRRFIRLAFNVSTSAYMSKHTWRANRRTRCLQADTGSVRALASVVPALLGRRCRCPTRAPLRVRCRRCLDIYSARFPSVQLQLASHFSPCASATINTAPADSCPVPFLLLGRSACWVPSRRFTSRHRLSVPFDRFGRFA